MEEFERRWAGFCHRQYGVAVTSGTAALQLAIRALDVGPGDEVIVPTFTIISCLVAVVDVGATPVLVDSDPVTWGIDVHRVEERITPRTKVILPVHMYGHPVDLDPILKVASSRRVSVIEDAAEAHGAEYLSARGTRHERWAPCGSFGDISVFSFYANKLVTTGEGGMAVTNDAALAGRLRSLRNLCFRPEKRFLHTELGFNFRLTNMQAALALSQLDRFDQIVARKRRIAEAYLERLREIPGIQLPPAEKWARSVYWMFGLVLEESRGLSAGALGASLAEKGIETRPFFLGMHEQPVWRARGLFRGEQYPVAERLSRQGLYLPSGLGLTETEIDRVTEAVKECLG